MRAGVGDRLAQGVLGSGLHTRIDGQTDVVARLRRAGSHDRPDGITEGIDAPLQRPVGAAQVTIEVLLNATLTNDVAGSRVAVRHLVLDLLRRHLTKFAPEMRGHRVELAALPTRRAVGARCPFDDTHPGELAGALLEVEENVAINVLGDHDRIERSLDGCGVDVVLDLCDRDADNLRKLTQLRIRLRAACPGTHRLATLELLVDRDEAGRATFLGEGIGAFDSLADAPRSLIRAASVDRPLDVATTPGQQIRKSRRINRNRVRWSTPDQHFARVVENLPTRGRNVDAAKTVRDRLRSVGLDIKHLQRPQAQDQDDHDDRGHHRENRHALAHAVTIKPLVTCRLLRLRWRRRIGEGWLVRARRTHAPDLSDTPAIRRSSGRMMMPTRSVKASSALA